MLNSDILVVYGVVLSMLVLLYREYFQPALIFLFAILIFYLKGIINVDEIVSGFSNTQILLIFLLIIISEIIKKTAALDQFIQHFFKETLSYKSFILRMGTLVSTLSAWFNNTPIVAFMTPFVYDWARKKGISPSKVMMPLSFVAVIGGTATLIGTSTNLIVNGLAVEAGYHELEIFDFYYIGIPIIVLGILFLAFFGNKILPSRKTFSTDFKEHSREYLVETSVPEGSKLIGKSIDEAELRNLQGLFLVEIHRRSKTIAPVSPREVIKKDDILIFAGETQTITELIKNSGELSLSLPDDFNGNFHQDTEVIEVVVSSKSYLIGKKAKKANFRKKYDAAILAIRRNGERLSGKIGDTELQVGDLLLLIAGKDFSSRPEVEQDLYVISNIKRIQYFDRRKKSILFIGLLLALVLSALKVLPLFVGMLGLLSILSLFRIIRLEDIKRSLDINLLLILVLALAMGKAITNSGAGDYLAHSLLSILPDSPIFALIGIYVITNIITLFVTNAASVAIAFPIAVSIVNQSGYADLKPFLLAITFAASAAFMTPFGYQTNLMVMGAGNYRFKDYFRLGLPLTIIYGACVIVILGLTFHLF